MNRPNLVLTLVLVASILFLSDAAPDEGGLVSKSEFFDGRTDWKPAGGVESWSLKGTDLTLTLAGSRPMVVSFSSPTVFRLYWDPAERDSGEPSEAVVQPLLGQTTPLITASPETLVVETG